MAPQHDVHPNLHNTWRRQARTGTLVSVAAGGCRFTPVTVAPDGVVIGPTRSGAAAEPAIEVVLRNGRVLRLPAGVSPALAVALADALEGIGR